MPVSINRQRPKWRDCAKNLTHSVAQKQHTGVVYATLRVDERARCATISIVLSHTVAYLRKPR